MRKSACINLLTNHSKLVLYLIYNKTTTSGSCCKLVATLPSIWSYLSKSNACRFPYIWEMHATIRVLRRTIWVLRDNIWVLREITRYGKPDVIYINILAWQTTRYSLANSQLESSFEPAWLEWVVQRLWNGLLHKASADGKHSLPDLIAWLHISAPRLVPSAVTSYLPSASVFTPRIVANLNTVRSTIHPATSHNEQSALCNSISK